MSQNRIIIWGAVFVAVACVVWYRSLVYPNPNLKTPKVVFVTGGSGPYWQITARGAKDAAEEYGVDLLVEMPSDEESLAQQIQILSRLNLDEIDGVAVSPLDADGQTRQISVMSEQTHVVTFDSDAPLSQRRCYVGTSNYGAGEMSAALIKEALPRGGQIAVLVANLTKDNNLQRQEGFRDGMLPADVPRDETNPTENAGPPAPVYEIVDYFVDDGDPEKCRQIIRQVLAAHPDLAGFVAMNGYHGPILLEILKEEGKRGDVKLVCFDEEEDTLVGIAEGHVYATVAQDPYNYGYEAVRILKQLSHGKPIVQRGSVSCDAVAVRQDNLDEFRAKLQLRLSSPETDAAGQEAG